MHLWCDFHVRGPMFAEEQLDGLQSVIHRLLPKWSAGLRVARDEDSPDPLLVGRAGRLYDCLHQAAPPKRGLGPAVLTGSYKGLSFFLNHFEGTLPPVLNTMAIEVYGPSVIEGQAVSIWARTFFEAVTAQFPIRYANVRLAEEFRAKNMIDDETGVEAIGVDITDAIPGLYWLNYLGALYLDLIGRERLLSAPAFEVKPVGDGVLLALDSSAEAWQSDAYRAREQATIEHLGKEFFFSRYEPERKTIAPDFARESKPRPG